jgi:hypothetical protein
VDLDKREITDLVKRSYQYVALYNVINKFALDPTNPMSTGGWNKMFKSTRLADADVQAIARPNNDTLYQIAMLDLRAEPVILDMPAFDSVYVSLETCAYDHYCGIPYSTRIGDGHKPQRLLFYTARTQDYDGAPVGGVDRVIELSGDYAVAALRMMPHANEPERFDRILTQIESLKLVTLSEFQHRAATPTTNEAFPAFGATDADTFGENLLEVMQFVFNHVTFDADDPMDRALLAAYEPLGIAPGRVWDPADKTIDNRAFRAVSEEVKEEQLSVVNDPAKAAAAIPHLFLPKGNAPLEFVVLQSVIGPIGQPAAEALYPPISSSNGEPLNALHDYTISMSADELPPATAFWSVTLYDHDDGFFIPNDRNKYSVGLNTGFKLDSSGGIVIHVAAEQPEGPAENWLPITRSDLGLSLIMRVYAPDLAKMRTWRPPVAVPVTPA